MIALVLGGARCGKSEVAEDMASAMPQPVTYLATGQASDAGMSARIAVHRARRPSAWETMELDRGADLARLLAATPGTALVDSLGTWVAGVDGFEVGGEWLCHALTNRRGDTVIVSEEVGLGVHPSTSLGNEFRDALGALNRMVADVCQDVRLVVAGRVLPLESR